MEEIISLFHSKLPIRMRDLDPPSNTRFLGPSQIYSPNSILIGSAVFTWLTIATDHATPSVTIQYRDVQLRKDAEL